MPEQYQVKCKQMWHKTRACLAGSPSVRRSLGTFPTLPLGFSLWALTRPIFTDFYRFFGLSWKTSPQTDSTYSNLLYLLYLLYLLLPTKFYLITYFYLPTYLSIEVSQ